MRKIIYTAILVSLFSNVFSQAYWDTVTVSPLEICLGQGVDPYSNGGNSTTLMFNDFNSNIIGAGWISNAQPSFDNPCNSTGDNWNGTTYLWVGDQTSFPRDLTTEAYEVADQCQICFDFKMATQGESTPCEGPDLANEGISLQWSTDGGTNWTDITYFCPDGAEYPSNTFNDADVNNVVSDDFNSWANYCYNVPPAAVGSNTQFQWHQITVTALTNDHWGIDNVYIHCPSPSVSITWNDSNNGDFYWDADPPIQYPTQNTIYTATIDDGIGSDVEIFDVIVYQPPTLSILGLNAAYCIDQAAVTMTASVIQEGSPVTPPGGIFSGPGVTGSQFNPATAGLGTHIITYTWDQHNTQGDILCTFSTTTSVIVNNGATADFTVISPICANSNSNITYTGTGTSSAIYTWDWGGMSATTGTGQGPHTATHSVPGTYTIALVVTENGCVGDPYTQTIEVVENPVANAGLTNVDVCGPDYTMTAISSVGIGTWTVSPATSTFVNANSATTNISVSAYGSYNYTWTEVNQMCTDNQTIVVNFYEIPTPNAGNDDYTCGPNYELNAAVSVGTGIWTTSSGAATIASPNSASSSTNVSVYGTYNYIFTENNHGCIASNDVDITYYQIPTSSFSASIVNCFGENTVVVYQGNASSSATYNWGWNGADVSPGNGQGPHYANWVTAGTYTISLDVTENGCQSTTTTNNIINPELLTISSSSTDILCFGDSSGTLSATVAGGTFPYSTIWNTGDSETSVMGLNGGNYQVIVTDAMGCTSSSISIINEPTELKLTQIENFYVCSGQSVNAQAEVTGGTPNYIYYWNGVQSTETSFYEPNIIYNSSHCVKVVDQNNCIDTTCFTISVSPPIELQLFSHTDTVCPNEPVLITANISGGIGPPYTITDNFTGNIVSPPELMYLSEDGQVSMTVEDGCGSKDSSIIDVYTYPLPPNDFSPDIFSGCQPLEISFIESNAQNGQTYLWDFGDFSTDNLSLDKNPTHIYNIPGTFSVSLTITSKEGCVNKQVKYNYISIFPKPEAKFIYKPEVATVINPTVDFNNLSTHLNAALWVFDDGDSSLFVNPSHTFSNKESKVYNVKLIVLSAYGCRDTAISEVEVKPVPTFYAPSAFSPDKDRVNDKFFVVGTAINPDEFVLNIYNRWGEIIWTTKIFDVELGQSEGWNGISKNNKYVQNGVYTWHVIYLDDNGNKQEYSGNVTLIN